MEGRAGSASSLRVEEACQAAGAQLTERFKGGQTTLVYECVAEGS